MSMDWACVCDCLFLLPVVEKGNHGIGEHELFMDVAILATAFSSRPSRKRPSWELGKYDMFMAQARVCD